jgi:hypothetical protein
MFSGNTSQVSADQLYVEDVFSTWLYTGNGSTQTITNGIDLAGKGGLVWTKVRNSNFNHILADTTRGGNNVLYSNSSVGNQAYGSTIYTAFGSTGYTLGNANEVNGAYNYASWTFREAPKFFDVVTYTGTGANRTIAHNLGVAPGCILIKRTNTSGDWQVYHRGNANTQYMVLNSTAAVVTDTTRWNSTTPTATEFTVGTDATVNASGGTYVAYLFAHDATSDGVIQCGSFTTDGSGNATVNLGYEPQWLMAKCASSTGNWFLFDTMRGLTADFTNPAATLFPNLTTQEVGNQYARVNATGFVVQSMVASQTYIYIAIRRGPMKTPTLGTSVFAPTLATFSGSTVTNTGFVVDMVINKTGVATTSNNFVLDRLRGSDNGANQQTMSTNETSAEVASSGRVALTGSVTVQNGFLEQNTTANNIVWAFRRAPSFFDEVCYSIPSAGSVNHNLGVVPEMMILKTRNTSDNWYVYHSGAPGKLLRLNTTAAADTANYSSVWGSSAPTATQFSVGGWGTYFNYVWYGFSSCPGVSKCGSYTGNGSSQTINCGFAAGARFVMIKRTDSTGDWYVWDTARGIVAGNDPHLSLNTTAAEVTTDDTIDTDSSGFVVNQVAATNVNVSSATYIYLAIA